MSVIYYLCIVHGDSRIDYTHGYDNFVDSLNMSDKRFRQRRIFKYVIPFFAFIYAAIAFAGGDPDQGSIIGCLGVGSFIIGKSIEQKMKDKN